MQVACKNMHAAYLSQRMDQRRIMQHRHKTASFCLFSAGLLLALLAASKLTSSASNAASSVDGVKPAQQLLGTPGDSSKGHRQVGA